MTEQSIVEQPKKKPLTVLDLLGGAKNRQLQEICGKRMGASTLVKFFAVAVQRKRALLACTGESFQEAMVKCAELSLYPGTLGSVHLIPFENKKQGTVECQMIVGYQGLLTLARRASDIRTIEAEVVRDGDVLEFEYGFNPLFRHVPAVGSGRPITHAWAMAKFINGGHQLAVMTVQEINQIRDRSRYGNAGPWVEHYPEMCKKTALRRLCKYLPLTPEIGAHIETADKVEFDFESPRVTDDQPHVGTVAERIVAKVAARNLDAVSDVQDEPTNDSAQHQAVREQIAAVESKADPKTEPGKEDLSFLSTPEKPQPGKRAKT